MVAGCADEFDLVQMYALFFGKSKNSCLKFSDWCIRTMTFISLVSRNPNDDKK